jgi:hypothetical protein
MGYRKNQVEKTNEMRNPDLIHSVEDEFTSFHYSTIPLFHVFGIKKMPLKTLYFPALIGGIEFPRRLLRLGLRRSSRMEIKKHVAATIIIEAPEVKLKV